MILKICYQDPIMILQLGSEIIISRLTKVNWPWCKMDEKYANKIANSSQPLNHCPSLGGHMFEKVNHGKKNWTNMLHKWPLMLQYKVSMTIMLLTHLLYSHYLRNILYHSCILFHTNKIPPTFLFIPLSEE